MTQTRNQFWEIDLSDGRRVYLNPSAIAYFEQDQEDGSFTLVQLVTGERLKLNEYFKTFWDRYYADDED